jgi:hypothetical protein
MNLATLERYVLEMAWEMSDVPHQRRAWIDGTEESWGAGSLREFVEVFASYHPEDLLSNPVPSSVFDVPEKRSALSDLLAKFNALASSPQDWVGPVSLVLDSPKWTAVVQAAQVLISQLSPEEVELLSEPFVGVKPDWTK